jgi:hypothetical protein
VRTPARTVPEVEVGDDATLEDACRARERDLRVHRDLPQPPSAPLEPRHAHTDRISTTQHASGRLNPETRLHRNPGTAQSPSKPGWLKSPPRADTTPAAGRCPGTETGTERCPVSSPPDRHNGTAVAKFHGERAILRPAGEVASSREGSDGEKGLGSFEEEGELQARARARGAVRSLHVHVPAARAWRLQVGQGADPGVRDLRRVQAPAAILTRATSLWGAKTRSAYKLDVS